MINLSDVMGTRVSGAMQNMLWLKRPYNNQVLFLIFYMKSQNNTSCLHILAYFSRAAVLNALNLY